MSFRSWGQSSRHQAEQRLCGRKSSGAPSGARREKGAGDAIRTRDIFLGKEVLYQLSYTRKPVCTLGDWSTACQGFFGVLNALPLSMPHPLD
jgi:hypothetical protein